MPAEPAPLVATVMGWKCSCDVPLQPLGDSDTGPQWQGTATTGKDGAGSVFRLRLTRDPSGTDRTLHLHFTATDGREITQVRPAHSLPEHRASSPASETALLAAPPSGFAASGSLAFTFDLGPFFGPPEPGDGGIPRSRLVVRVAGHAELKSRFWNSAFGLSYLPVLWDRYVGGDHPRPAPRRILEWGPGRSTIAFAEFFPEATIDGIEHDPRWFEHCRALEDAFPGGRVRMHRRRLAIAPGRAEGYVTWPLYQAPDTRYDLIFIDGRLRVDCAAVARLVLAEGGTVLIHDAHRENYRPVFELFPAGEVVYNTGVLGMGCRLDTGIV